LYRPIIAHFNWAVADGAKVDGYFIWTMLDNFEWAEGYRPRFGLIYIDFKTQKRILKQSALWYADYITANSN
jgi:beta-glucosidase